MGPSTLICGIAVHPRVIALAARQGLDLADLIRCVRQPEATWPAQRDGVVSLRGPIAVITSDDGEIVAVTDRQRALTQRQQPRYGAQQRVKGTGGGGQAPTTVPGLLAALRAAGCEIVEDRRHYIAKRATKPGVQVTIPRTPSDHRSIPNAVAQIRRALGIDLRT